MDSFRFVSPIQQTPMALYYRVLDTFLVAVFKESMGNNLTVALAHFSKEYQLSQQGSREAAPYTASQSRPSDVNDSVELTFSFPSSLSPSPQESVITHMESGPSHLD